MVGGSKSKWGLAVAAAAFVLGVAGVNLDAAARAGEGPSGPAASPAVGTVPLAALPAEAQQTERLIRTGGPFPHAKDGTVFGNRERILPRHPRGYYREYTVRTPGSSDRGARRIVCGGHKPREPEACFYTEDHYASFRRIAP
jgi:ribonuclease T1